MKSRNEYIDIAKGIAILSSFNKFTSKLKYWSFFIIIAKYLKFNIKKSGCKGVETFLFHLSHFCETTYSFFIGYLQHIQT